MPQAEKTARELARDTLLRVECDRAWVTPLLARHESRFADRRDAVFFRASLNF